MVRLAGSGDAFDGCVANFLDEFNVAPGEGALSATPELLAPTLGERGCVQDAYLAAAAEHLACVHGFSVPAWAATDERNPHRP